MAKKVNFISVGNIRVNVRQIKRYYAYKGRMEIPCVEIDYYDTSVSDIVRFHDMKSAQKAIKTLDKAVGMLEIKGEL